MRLDGWEKTEFTEEDAERALRQPDSFALWPTAPHYKEMYITWAIGPVIEHRESGLIDRSNAIALRRELAKHPEFEGDYEEHRASHWAVGHVTHLSYRVLDAEGQPTKIARFLKAWCTYLGDVYPIADEDLYSEMEWDATVEAFEEEANRLVRSNPPEGWIERVWDWLDEHYPEDRESYDDQGVYPHHMDECLRALGLHKDQEEEEDARE